MTFKAVDYSLENKCYVVRGNNLDNDGQLSNGSGKTSLVDIIAVVLLGYSLTGRNAKDCVSWDSEAGFFTVELNMENLEHKMTCSIQRKVYSNTKSGELVILVNDEVPTSIPRKKGVENGVDVKAGDAYILESILDLNSLDLLNYYLISGKYYQPFLKVNTDKKLEVIHRFSKAEIVDKAIKKLEVEQETINDSIEEYERNINTVTGYIQALEDSLVNGDAERVFNEERDAKINRLKEDQKEIEDKLLELERESTYKQAEIVQLKTSLKKFDEEWLEETQKIIIQAKQELKGFGKEKRELNERIAKIENHLAGLITCPKCEHEFSLMENKFTKKDLLNTQKELAVREAEEEDLISGIEEVEKEWIGVNEIKEFNRITNSTIEIKFSECGAISKQQLRLANEYEEIGEKIIKEQNTSFKDEKTAVKLQIKEKQEEKLAYEQQLKSVNEDNETNKKWINHFEDFRFYLGNKPLELICSLVNQYLKYNGSDLNLHIEGFKKLKSGEIRQALQPVIYRNWMNGRDYNQFSEGERVRLNLSVDLAFQQLINSSSKYGGLDFYANDEMISGLDSLGVANAAESFNGLNKTMLLVTHSGADLNYSNTILVEKENGISKIL